MLFVIITGEENIIMRTKRIAVVLLVSLFILAVLLSHAFVITEAHHDCSGHDCAVCQVLALAKNLIKTAGILLLCLVVFLQAFSLHSVVFNVVGKVYCSTPVSLKVKLSN